MATLYLMVGLPCSGKTTRAKELENELFALRLTPDEWHINLFGHDVYDPEHDKRHALIEEFTVGGSFIEHNKNAYRLTAVSRARTENIRNSMRNKKGSSPMVPLSL